jgi:hypothetical protein
MRAVGVFLMRSATSMAGVAWFAFCIYGWYWVAEPCKVFSNHQGPHIQLVTLAILNVIIFLMSAAVGGIGLSAAYMIWKVD